MDSKKKYDQMVEDGEIPQASDIRPAHEYKHINYVARDNANYIWVLDFEDGKVYRYDISVLGNEENGWNPDSESCEAFLYGAGHKVNNCEWMVTTNENIEKDGITD